MKSFAFDRGGATAIEYALVAGLISMAIITVLGGLGSTLTTTFYGALASAP